MIAFQNVMHKLTLFRILAKLTNQGQNIGAACRRIVITILIDRFDAHLFAAKVPAPISR